MVAFHKIKMIDTNIIKEAIKNKRQLLVNYENDGYRKILPAALYKHPGSGKLLIDAFQTDGYSKSGEVPGWKMFEVEKIYQANITDLFFSTIDGYNRLSRRYLYAIVKI